MHCTLLATVSIFQRGMTSNQYHGVLVKVTATLYCFSKYLDPKLLPIFQVCFRPLPSTYLSHAHLPVLLYMKSNLKSTVPVDSFDQWHIAIRYMGIWIHSARRNLLSLPHYMHFSVRLLNKSLAMKMKGKNKEQLKKKFEENTDYFNASLIWAVPNKEVWFALKSVIGTQLFLDSTACW